MKWTAEDSEEEGMFDINTGKHILRMVTDDYQMACDLCNEHNDDTTNESNSVLDGG